MVACDGAVFYLASRTYGAPWRVLLGDEALKETLAEGPAPVTAEALVPFQQGIVTRRACAVVARRRKESSNELSLLA